MANFTLPLQNVSYDISLTFILLESLINNEKSTKGEDMFRLALAIPCIPTIKGTWLTNRRDSRFWLCSPLDIFQNISDTWHRFSRRLPKNTIIFRDPDGKVIGYGEKRKEGQ